jgi:hypothetical protein
MLLSAAWRGCAVLVVLPLLDRLIVNAIRVNRRAGNMTKKDLNAVRENDAETTH